MQLIPAHSTECTYIYQLSANNQKYLNQMYLFAFSTIDVRWTLQYVFVLGKLYSNTYK